MSLAESNMVDMTSAYLCAGEKDDVMVMPVRVTWGPIKVHCVFKDLALSLVAETHWAILCLWRHMKSHTSYVSLSQTRVSFYSGVNTGEGDLRIESSNNIFFEIG